MDDSKAVILVSGRGRGRGRGRGCGRELLVLEWFQL